MRIFLIEQIQLDSWENSRDAALYYKPIGYTNDRQEASRFSEEGTNYTNKDCWAIGTGNTCPEYKVTELKLITK